MEHIILSLELLESLKDFDTWKEFKNNPDFFKDKDTTIIKKKKQGKVLYEDPWDNYNGTNFGY